MFQGSQIIRIKGKSVCRFIIYGFTSRSRIHLLAIAGEGLQNFILYPEFLALLAKYLCQRLTVLQESCNKLATSVVKIHLNT
jgi:hypothetical protein